MTAAAAEVGAPLVEPVEGGAPGWRELAACARPGLDPEMFFPTWGHARQEERIAKWFCHRICPVREDCLADALRHEAGRHAEDRHGVWGGMSPRQRADLDETRRGPGRPRVYCRWPGRTAGLEDHARIGDEPCAPCREFSLRRSARMERDERAAELAGAGRSVGEIAMTLGERRDTVRGILSRREDLPLNPLELVLERQVGLGN